MGCRLWGRTELDTTEVTQQQQQQQQCYKKKGCGQTLYCLSHQGSPHDQWVTIKRNTLQITGVSGEKEREKEIESLFKEIMTAAAATAKSLQLCPTLCDPIDGSPPGSPIPGILQARTAEWVDISFPNLKAPAP